MPVSIDKQIEVIQMRMEKDRKRLAELKRKKQEMIVRTVNSANKKDIATLIKNGKTTEEIISFLKSKR